MSTDLEKAKTVEEWLNGVDYGSDQFYVPSEFALEFVNFIKLVNGGAGEENKTPVLHYRMLDQVAGSEARIANMVHRGAAKTTIMGEYFILYLAVNGGRLPNFGRIECAIYLSDSIENGVKSMRKNLQYRWENSDFLQKYLPDGGGTKFTDDRWQFCNIEGDFFIVKGFGAKTGIRGFKEMGKRPKLGILDDLVSDEDARSQTVIASIEATVHKAMNFALSPSKNKVIWSGTPFNAGDPLYKAVESGAWKVNVYPVCERFPCSKEEFRGSWEDRFDYNYVKTEYDRAMKQGMVHTFDQELMLRIMSEEDRLIRDTDMNWYSKSNLWKNRHLFNFYITTDFATSESEAADFSVISVWALNNNGDWFWVDGICVKQNMADNIEDLFKMVSKYKPQSVGIEVSGQQGGFIPWIQNEMMSKNIWFNLASGNNSTKLGIRPTTNKLQRFNVVVPWFKAGKMFFPDDDRLNPALVEMMEELRLASAGGFKSKYDDALDTVSMLAQMSAYKPSETGLGSSENNIYYVDVDSDDDEGTYSSYVV